MFGLAWLFRLFGTIPVGELETGADPQAVRNMFASISKALADGKSVLLYPSGRIYVQNFENLTGKQAAYEVISTLPKNVRIIAVRTRGLWGSIWSKAYTGDSPSLFRTLLFAKWMILANFLFFVPKRSVTITLQDVTKEAMQASQQ